LDWNVNIEFNGSEMVPEEVRVAYINVTIPADAEEGIWVKFSLTAFSCTNPSVQDKINITTFVHNYVGESNGFTISFLLPGILVALITYTYRIPRTSRCL
ncbi:MAG: hypothetical protein QW115_07290, partial [Thermoplasmata archaeon]